MSELTDDQRLDRSIRFMDRALGVGLIGLGSALSVSLVASCLQLNAWNHNRQERLKDTVTADLTADGFRVEDVESIILVSPPFRPDAVLKVGNCMLTFSVNKRDGHWQLDPWGDNALSQVGLPKGSPITPTILNQAHPECFK